MQEKYNKLETEKEILMVDLDKMKIQIEQKQQQYLQIEEDHNNLLKKLADMEQKQASEGVGVDSGQITVLSQQLEIQTGVLARLEEELEAVRHERETYKKMAEEQKKVERNGIQKDM